MNRLNLPPFCRNLLVTASTARSGPCVSSSSATVASPRFEQQPPFRLQALATRHIIGVSVAHHSQTRHHRAHRNAAFKGYSGRLTIQDADLMSQARASELSTIRVQTDTGAPVLNPEVAESFEEVEGVLPQPLAEALQKWRTKHGHAAPTGTQRVVWPLGLSGRDVCCVSPTSSGKTMAYLIPLLSKIIQERMGTQAQRERDQERSREEALAAAATCPDCGLLMTGPRRAPVCRATGAPHPPPSLVNETAVARMMRLQDDRGDIAPKAIILVPTILLAAQIDRVITQFGCGIKAAMYVRVNDRQKIVDIEEKARASDIIVTTPGTLLPAIGANSRLSLKDCNTFVLDEVDALLGRKMFEVTVPILKRFRQEQNQRETRRNNDLTIGNSSPAHSAQVVAFSASLSPTLYDIAKKFVLKKGHRKVIANVSESGRSTGSRSVSVSNKIVHNIYMVGPKLRLDKLRWLHESGMVPPRKKLIIFCNSRGTVDWLSNEIPDVCQRPTIVVSGQSTQHAQEKALQMHNNRAAEWLVATDVAARGLDFEDAWVLNWDMPDDFETFTHRAGRTGRHGQNGVCFTFFQPCDVKQARPLVDLLREQQQQIPSRLAEYARQDPLQHFVSNNKYQSRRATNEVRDTRYQSSVYSKGFLKRPVGA